MHRYGGVTKVRGECDNCESELVMYVMADGGPIPNGRDECDRCEESTFRPTN